VVHLTLRDLQEYWVVHLVFALLAIIAHQARIILLNALQEPLHQQLDCRILPIVNHAQLGSIVQNPVKILLLICVTKATIA